MIIIQPRHSCLEDVLMQKNVKSILSINLNKGIIGGSRIDLKIEEFWWSPLSELPASCTEKLLKSEFSSSGSHTHTALYLAMLSEELRAKSELSTHEGPH